VVAVHNVVPINTFFLMVAILCFAAFHGAGVPHRTVVAVFVGTPVANRPADQGARYGRSIIAVAAAKLMAYDAADKGTS
jgi:hypothetical protein